MDHLAAYVKNQDAQFVFMTLYYFFAISLLLLLSWLSQDHDFLCKESVAAGIETLKPTIKTSNQYQELRVDF